jgi:hypothetical protein
MRTYLDYIDCGYSQIKCELIATFSIRLLSHTKNYGDYVVIFSDGEKQLDAQEYNGGIAHKFYDSIRTTVRLTLRNICPDGVVF